MTDAPERMWLQQIGDGFNPVWGRDIPRSGSVGYVRADLHESALARVAKLERAMGYVMDGYGLNAPDFRQIETDEDGERVQDDWIVSCIRAALATP